jgi:hypothetical protein
MIITMLYQKSIMRLSDFFCPEIGYLYETQLSFGGKSAPFFFQLGGRGFRMILRSVGVDCHHYLDYIWVNGPAC